MKETNNDKVKKTDDYLDDDFMEDPRYKQCNKEAIYGVVLGLINMVWWYIFGYGLGDKPVDEYTYIAGWPSWFFWSCIVGSILCIVATLFMVDKLFKNMPLDRFTKEEAIEYAKKLEDKEV